MNNFEIKVNGQKYTLWKSATFSRSLDYMVGTFNFLTSQRPEFPVNRGDSVQIYVNNILQMTGFVFMKVTSGGMDGVTVKVSGFEKTKDLLDSSIPDEAKQIEGEETTLQRVCEKVISGLGLGISVIDQTGGIKPFTFEDSEAAASCSNAFDFLESFSRKRQIYLVTNNQGNLVLYRPGSEKAVSPLIHQADGLRNNIKSFILNDSDEQRFNRVICRSQDNIGYSLFFPDDDTDRNATAIDSEIRASRYLEIRAEESMEETECLARAKEEVNNRRLKGLSYSCELASQMQSDGSLYEIGQLVTVIDDFAKVRGTFLLKSITNQSAMKKNVTGSRVDLTLTRPDAYTPQDELTTTVTRKSKIDAQ